MVVLEDLDEATAQLVTDLARLSGADVRDGGSGGPVEGGRDGDVVLTVAGRPLEGGGGGRAHGRGAPRIVVGDLGAIRLPEDRALVADLIAQFATRRPSDDLVAGTRAGAGAPVAVVLGVAGWHDGADSASLALLMARRVGCPLVDAAGAGPGAWGTGGLPPTGVRWPDLSNDEASFPPRLVDQLPRLSGVPVLGTDARGAAHPGDPRLEPALRALRAGGPVVVDLGRWDDRASAACGPPPTGAGIDVVCLVGTGDRDSAIRLAGAVGAHPPWAPVVLAHRTRRPSGVLAGAADSGWVIGRAPAGGVGPVARRRLDHLWRQARDQAARSGVHPLAGGGAVTRR